MNTRIIIRKQLLDLNVPGSGEGYRIQKEAQKLHQNTLIPLIQELFDEIVPEGESWHIDTLKLDLGSVHFTETELATDPGLKDTLRKQLQKVFLTSNIIRDQSPPSWPVTKEPKAIHSFKQWIFYLHHGYLPWEASLPLEQWHHDILEAMSSQESLPQRLQEILRYNRHALTRMLKESDGQFLEKLVKILTGEKFYRDNIQKFREADSRQVVSTDSPLKVHERSAEGRLLHYWLAADENKINTGHSEINTLILGQPSSTLSANQAEEGSQFPNLGMILLHPFIPHLFRHTGLCQGNEFVSEGVRQTAARLLHFAATGFPDQEEHQMAVAKLLTGIELHTSLDHIYMPSVPMLEEAEQMLSSVIAHWTILKQTSISGLRESFLQRSGICRIKENTLFIQMESATVDVLLDHLPWNLSMIKLPWLNHLIKVNWR